MKHFIIFLFLVLLIGCTTTGMKGTEGLGDDKLSVIWLHQDIITPFRVKSLNGEGVRQAFLAKIKDVPGKKIMVIELWHTYVENGTSAKSKFQFDLEFNSKPGYSYNFKLKNGDYSVVSKDVEVCVLEEQHDAIGSSVNYTGEFRVPSKNAAEIFCAKGRSVPI